MNEHFVLALKTHLQVEVLQGIKSSKIDLESPYWSKFIFNEDKYYQRAYSLARLYFDGYEWSLDDRVLSYEQIYSNKKIKWGNYESNNS